jgi:hypothetical protein
VFVLRLSSRILSRRSGRRTLKLARQHRLITLGGQDGLEESGEGAVAVWVGVAVAQTFRDEQEAQRQMRTAGEAVARRRAASSRYVPYSEPFGAWAREFRENHGQEAANALLWKMLGRVGGATGSSSSGTAPMTQGEANVHNGIGRWTAPNQYWDPTVPK